MCAAAEAEAARQEIENYYTLWAHQIKTPIAAMHLLLETGGGSEHDALAAELLKIEQYVEMVLTYLRLDGGGSDLVLRRVPLDEQVRTSLRKLARLFILKKLTVCFDETGRTVLSDEKWLGFVVEQVLSNAIKYTPRGGTIRIYGHGEALVIADSGIGIRAEDLPRVFEKGFTGFNGREDKKSSGIGLYLCRRIMERLVGAITIVSQPGEGTVVRLHLPEREQVME